MAIDTGAVNDFGAWREEKQRQAIIMGTPEQSNEPTQEYNKSELAGDWGGPGTSPMESVMRLAGFGSSIWNYGKGAYQGGAEVYKQREALGNVAYIDDWGGITPKEGYTEEDIAPQKEEFETAQKRFSEETVSPTAMIVGSVLAPKLVIPGIIASQITEGYKKTEGATGQKVAGGLKQATYGPLEEMITDPEAKEKFEQNPAGQTANALLAAGQVMLPFEIGRRIIDHKLGKVKPQEQVQQQGVPAEEGADIIAIGEKQLGKPYKLESNGIDATDCGKFTQDVFAEKGIEFEKRTADGQYYQLEQEGKTFTDEGQLQEGDLVFWDVPSNRERWEPSGDPAAVNVDNQAYKGITHVGIYAGNGKVLQAGGKGVGYINLDTYPIVSFGRALEGAGEYRFAGAGRKTSLDIADEFGQWKEIREEETISRKNTEIQERERVIEELPTNKIADIEFVDKSGDKINVSWTGRQLKENTVIGADGIRMSTDHDYMVSKVTPETVQPLFGNKPKEKQSVPVNGTITRDDILKTLRDVVATRTGKIIKRNALGIFKTDAEVIRSREYGDFSTLAHELGHYVDKKLNLVDPQYETELVSWVEKKWPNGEYSQEVRPKEGVAEFVQQYLFNPEEARKNFPTFYDHFEKAISADKEISSTVKIVQEQMKKWFGQSPEARGRAGVSFGYERKAEDIVKKAKDTWYDVYEKLFDDKIGLAKAVKDAEKSLGIKLEAEENPYVLSRLAQSSATARAQMLVEDVNPSLAINTLNKMYNGNLIHDVTIKSILAKLDANTFDNAYPDYLKNGNFKDWREAFDTYLVAKRQAELQAINPDYTGPISKADVDAIIKNAPAKFSEIAKDFYQYNDNLMRIGVGEGLIKREVYAELKKKYPNYAPMARDFADEAAFIDSFGTGKGFGNVKNPLKKITEEGSARAVISPLESTIRNTYVMLNLAERNRVGLSFVKLSGVEGSGKFVEEVTGNADAKQSIFTVWVAGEKQAYQTTPDIYRAIMSVNQEGANFLTSLLSAPAGWLRAGATLNPDFIVKNALRDASSAAVYSKVGFIPGYDSIKGLAALFKNQELYYEYKASGALMSTLTGLDRDYMQKSIKDLLKKGMPVNPVEGLRNLTEYGETATRLAEYKNVKEKGGTMTEAALAARDVTIDFGRSGTWSKPYNRVTAFFNAFMQGQDRMVRAFREDKLGTSQRIAMYIIAPSVVLWFINKDEEWYHNMPRYQRDLFWMFKVGDTIVRIPKPFEPGLIFGSGAERFLDWAYNKDPKALEEWWKSAKSGLLPNVIPTVASPLLEWATNYSFFRDRPIVPQRLQKLPPEKQIGPYTSEAAKLIGGTFGISPMKVDNTIYGYGAGLARLFNDFLDITLDKNKPEKKISEYPVIRSFTVNPNASNRNTQEFYDKLEKLEQQHTTEQKGKVSKELRDFRKSSKDLQEINKKQRTIIEDKNMDPAVKRRKIDELDVKENNIIKKALKK
jgi:hypothetical protein